MRYDNGKEIVWNFRIHGSSVFIDVVGPPHPLSSINYETQH